MNILPTTKTPPKINWALPIILLYGFAKSGKSTLCSHFENALFLATEPGLNSLNVFQVLIRCWEDLLNVCAEIERGNHSFKTIIIDTVDNMCRFCTEYVLKKHGLEHESDLPFGKGYAMVMAELQRVLTKLGFLPYGLVLISHAKEIEIDDRTGKYTRMVPALPDKARNIVLGMADMVLFCDMELQTGADGERTVRRVIRTKPSLYYEAGDRTGRLPETLDLDFEKFAAAFNVATACQPANGTAPKTSAPGK
jgi:hypothetical protein